MRLRKIDYNYMRSNPFSTLGSTGTFQVREIAMELLEAIQSGGHRGNLLSLHGDLMNALDSIWIRASDGLMQVESLAILRAMRSVTGPDIQTQLLKPNLDYRKIVMDLRLFINTIDHLLMPRPRGFDSRCRAH